MGRHYINLLRASKIALYSTPGMDAARTDTNGFNPVTPRFLECLAAQCHVISRFKKNADTDYYQMSEMSTSVDTFESFALAIDRALSSYIDVNSYESYLAEHYTSVRAKELMDL